MYGCRSYFEREWLDQALLVGMTPDEFWYGDPELFYNYSRVYAEKYKLEQQNVWQIGARMCQALQSTPIAPLGVVDKNVLRQLPGYPECPFYVAPNEEEYTETEKEFLRKKFLAKVTNWVNGCKK